MESLLACLQFWSRLPVPARDHAPDLSRAIRALPLAGLVIASPAVVALGIAHVLGLSPLVAAGLAIATLVITTGTLHEDGLADAADGLFGGWTRERRLEIMRDSRIGTYGAAALCLSLALRIAALAALCERSAWLAASALLCGAAISRTLGLLPLACLPPARHDGLSAGISPDRNAFQFAILLALLALALPVLAGASLARVIVAGGIAVVAAYLPVPLARAKIGGQTGDIAGASQQLSDIAFLVLLSGAA